MKCTTFPTDKSERSAHRRSSDSVSVAEIALIEVSDDEGEANSNQNNYELILSDQDVGSADSPKQEDQKITSVSSSDEASHSISTSRKEKKKRRSKRKKHAVRLVANLKNGRTNTFKGLYVEGELIQDGTADQRYRRLPRLGTSYF